MRALLARLVLTTGRQHQPEQRLDRVKARLMQGCCGPHRSTSGLLLCTICMHYVHHMQEGADDVSGLLIAALTASAHAIGRGSEGACSTCHAVLLQPT